MTKETLHADAWLKEVAPSTELRQWFGHRVERWDAFRRRYRKELIGNADAWSPLLDASRRGTLTLLYSAHDTEHNGARVLCEFLTERSRRHRPTAKRAKAGASGRRGGTRPAKLG
jgi:uncharacterized protein YeaO (DUF488 family)